MKNFPQLSKAVHDSKASNDKSFINSIFSILKDSLKGEGKNIPEGYQQACNEALYMIQKHLNNLH